MRSKEQQAQPRLLQAQASLRLLELAHVLVRFDHVASKSTVKLRPLFDLYIHNRLRMVGP
jgi:hypothetical protein